MVNGLKRGLETLDLPMGEINYFNVDGTTIIISGISNGSSNMVVCNPITTLTSESSEFDMPSNGRLRYTGIQTFMFHIACTVTIAPAGANDIFVIGIAKNGTVIPESKVLQKIINANDTQSTALHVMPQLSNNDYIELFIGNTTATNNLTIKSVTLFAMGV